MPTTKAKDIYKALVGAKNLGEYYGGSVGMQQDTKFSPEALKRMIRTRLHLSDDRELPFEHLHAVKVDDVRAVVLVINKKKEHVLIEDKWELFPSDALITQLRMLQ